MRGFWALSVTALALAGCESGDQPQPVVTESSPEALEPSTQVPAEVVSPVGADSEMPNRADAPAVSIQPRIPVFNAICGNDIDVHANAGGPVFIDGEEAELKKFNDNYFEATRGATTVSISFRPDDTLSLTFSGANRANGICNPK